MPSLGRTDTARPRGNAAAAANLLAGVPAPRPPVMRAPVEFGNAAVNTSLPVGWGQLAQKLIVRVDERNAAMRAIQIARLDGPQAAEVVEIAEPAVTVRSSSTCTPRAWRFRMQCKPVGST